MAAKQKTTTKAMPSPENSALRARPVSITGARAMAAAAASTSASGTSEHTSSAGKSAASTTASFGAVCDSGAPSSPSPRPTARK